MEDGVRDMVGGGGEGVGGGGVGSADTVVEADREGEVGGMNDGVGNRGIQGQQDEVGQLAGQYGRCGLQGWKLCNSRARMEEIGVIVRGHKAV